MVYRAIISFAMDDKRAIKQGQILQDSDFKNEAEKNDLLESGYIMEYDGQIEITENGTYDVKDYDTADVNVSGGTANLQDKTVTITTNGSQDINADSGYDGLDTVSVTTNVQPNLETKNVTIIENTTTTITPTAGKDGLSNVNITVDVPSGGDISEYFNTTITKGTFNYPVAGQCIKKMLPITVTSAVTVLSNAFMKWSELTEVIFSNQSNTSNVTAMNEMFLDCTKLSSVDVSSFNTSNVQYFLSVFQNCSSLTRLDLKNFDNSSATTMNDMFNGCKNLQFLDIRNFVFGTATTNRMFGMNASYGVPNNCEIIVKSDTEKQWMASNFSRLTNVKTVAEYEGQ